MIDNNMKRIWWEHVVSHRKLWPNGFTARRLAKVENKITEHIWSDLLIRHNGNEVRPCELRKKDEETYWHGVSNFTCSVLYVMIKHGIYKP